MKIGVFDSGVGGKSVANAIQKAFPEHEVMYAEDHKNVPYGSKPPELLLKLVTPILNRLIEDGCDVIVIACNTVTTTIISELRSRISAPLVAVEPMVKPGAEMTKSGVIAVCATPTTLASKRFAELKNEYAKNVTVLEPDCSEWALMIEKGAVEQRHLKNTIESCLNSGADVIVLGCTHYHWIEENINALCQGRAAVLQPEQAIIAQLRQVLKQLA